MREYGDAGCGRFKQNNPFSNSIKEKTPGEVLHITLFQDFRMGLFRYEEFHIIRAAGAFAVNIL